MSRVLLESGKNYLLFDGDCGICTYSSELAARLDRQRQFTLAPYQAFSESELARYGITYAACQRKLQVITARGRVYTGAFGVNNFLWRQFPWSLLVVLIYALPVLLVLEVIGYALVAHNRHRLSQWFGMKACLLRNQSVE
jgi:predicted DCC family thiol-disulfide oxidoreductase YuxK